MAKFEKCLCHIKKKDIVDNMKKFTEVVDTPQYVCSSCARVANKKKNLCSPKKLKRSTEEASS